MRAAAKRHKLFIAILALGLVLRLGYGLAQDHAAVYTDTGGDSGWYLKNGYALVTEDIEEGEPINIADLPTAPLYLVFAGIWQALLAPEAAVIAMRVSQTLMSAATIFFVYRLAWLLARDERAGLLAAAAVASASPFVMEAARIGNETMYIFFLAAGLWVYVSLIAETSEGVQPGLTIWRGLALAGALLGLATLTRAVLLIFPAGLALHLALVYGWRAGLKRALLLVAVYSLFVSTWTVYNLARWDRLVIGAQGLTAFLYIGAVGWEGPDAVDESLVEIPDDAGDTGFRVTGDDYIAGLNETVSADPLGYVRRRVGELAGAYAQPYGTVPFGGESLKALASSWLRDDRTPGGFADILRGDSFWPKLSVWTLHVTALLAGLAGLWLARARWRVALPLAGFILYTTLAHLALTALPRYIFPTEPFWWVFAALALTRAVERLILIRQGQKESD